MSKRKYNRYVTEVIYAQKYCDDSVTRYTSTLRESDYTLPCRIVRESFYRRLICYFEHYASEKEITERIK